MVEQLGAHVEDEALADAGRVPALPEVQHRVGDRERHRAQGQPGDQEPVLLGHGGVQQRPEEQRGDGGHDRGRDRRDEEADEQPAIRARETEDPSDEGPVDPLARHRIRVAAEAPHRLIHHLALKPTGVPGDSPARFVRQCRP